MVLALVNLDQVRSAPVEEAVTSIPGYPAFDFGMYSGYVALPRSTKQIHYLLVESQRDPANDPLVIWYSGGPGCSSMLAWAQEHGPFLMETTS